MVTFHSSEPLTIKINDILEGNVHKTACNILIDNFFTNAEEDDSGKLSNPFFLVKTIYLLSL